MTKAAAHYDELETRAPELREGAQLAACARPDRACQGEGARPDARPLRGHRSARGHHPRRARGAAGDAQVRARWSCQAADAALRRPRTRWRQANVARIFMSPGPIYDPEGGRADYWRLGRALFAAGFRAGDIIHNSFSYHLTPAGSMLEDGARSAGLRGDSRRHRPDRAAAASDRRSAGRTAMPARPPSCASSWRRARELGADLALAQEGAGRRGEAFPPALAEGDRGPRHRGAAMLCDRRSRPHRL